MGAAEPRVFETPDEAYEAVSNHDQVLLVHPVSDTPILDLAQPLMGPYAKVGTLRVDSVEQGLQDPDEPHHARND